MTEACSWTKKPRVHRANCYISRMNTLGFCCATANVNIYFWIIRKLRHNQFQRAADSVLPAEVESWGILLEEEDDSVWSADKYIYT